MEKDSPSKPSVAELAGRFKGHILPMPTSNDEKTSVPPNPLKIKMKNSAIIEKLQANLALSPTALLPSPKSPEVTLQPAPLSPSAPCSPQSPLSPTLRPSRLSSEEEDPVSFKDPPEGTPLPSINKTRARLSFKRRPPTRQHRRSAGEEAGAFRSTSSPCELQCRKENGDEEQVFESPAEGGEPRQSAEEVEEKNGDCDNADDEVTKRDPDNSRGRGMEQEAEEVQSLKTLEEEGQESSELCPTEQMGSDVKTEEGQGEVAQEGHQGGGDQL
ncbi:uncharacterized protein V6R79_015840 [Siganus canaliculatus]